MGWPTSLPGFHPRSSAGIRRDKSARQPRPWRVNFARAALRLLHWLACRAIARSAPAFRNRMPAYAPAGLRRGSLRSRCAASEGWRRGWESPPLAEFARQHDLWSVPTPFSGNRLCRWSQALSTILDTKTTALGVQEWPQTSTKREVCHPATVEPLTTVTVRLWSAFDR